MKRKVIYSLLVALVILVSGCTQENRNNNNTNTATTENSQNEKRTVKSGSTLIDRVSEEVKAVFNN